ncbi:FtsW/RodA/SpoVE family cell cycle protein [Paenibacillus sp. KN14-4R]|uniref:FtsW/RodA/SpoVE family cell cycle protein n=1 Tax=Paenibacillus sp. KN14-4R TaxID=3445773 RepID=UPI003FA18CDE
MSKESIESYLDQVCQHIKAKELHGVIRQELEGHYAELTHDYIADGHTEEEAGKLAVKQLGDPVDVGKGFNKVHRPKTDWWLVGMIGVLVGFAVLMILYTSTEKYYMMYAAPYYLRFFYLFIGICFMLGCMFFDYRKIKKYSWHLYIGALLLIVFTIYTKVSINGSPYLRIGPFSISAYTIASYMLLIGLCGIVQHPLHNQKINKLVLRLAVLIPFIFFWTTLDLSQYGIYLVGLLTLLWFAPKMKVLFVSIIGVHLILLCILFFIRMNYIKNHLNVRWSNIDPLTASSLKSIRESGMWGHGAGVFKHKVPDIFTNFIFTYFIHAIGWLAGAVLLVLLLTLVVNLFKISIRTRDSYGKLLTLTLSAYLGVQLLYGPLMSLGLIPPAGITTPILSVGGLNLILSLATFGLILGIYRRKDLINPIIVK